MRLCSAGDVLRDGSVRRCGPPVWIEGLDPAAILSQGQHEAGPALQHSFIAGGDALPRAQLSAAENTADDAVDGGLHVPA